MRALDLTGRRFGKLVAVESRGSVSGQGPTWLVHCDCGAEKVMTSRRLIAGYTSSCGCIGRFALGDRNRTHGDSRSVEFRTWQAIIKRCENTRERNFNRYGGRGIKVCERGRNSYQAFLADMGRRPPGRMSIDRINNDGNYEPGNCRWADYSVQRRNQEGFRPNDYRCVECSTFRFHRRRGGRCVECYRSVPRRVPVEKTEDVFRLWFSGLSAAEIGKGLGVDRMAIYAVLRSKARRTSFIVKRNSPHGLPLRERAIANAQRREEEARK